MCNDKYTHIQKANTLTTTVHNLLLTVMLPPVFYIWYSLQLYFDVF